MGELDLTTSEKDVMRIYITQRAKHEFPIVGAQQAADVLKLSRARTYAILLQLQKKRFVQKLARKGFILTKEGEKEVDNLIHRLKIIEIYLYQELHMPLETANAEASNLCLHISEELNQLLCKVLDKPNKCPHDITIPHTK